jgi:hypothetical protein
MNPKELRSQIFIHLDGIVLVPILHVLHKKGVLHYVLEHRKTQLSNLAKEFNANDGYLNVGLHALCSQGFLTQKITENDVIFEISTRGEDYFRFVSLFDEVMPLLEFAVCSKDKMFNEMHFSKIITVFEKFQNSFHHTPINETDKAIFNLVLSHIEGFLVGPLIVQLGMKGMFHKYFMEKSFRPEEFHEQVDGFTQILNFFTHLGWFISFNGNYQFTDKGLFFARRATAYGVTVSYAPMFRHLDELIFGDALFLERQRKSNTESHVDRAMNVWGSGGAHATYFKVIDEIVVQIFNQPLEKQPKGILDMGCGNGAFLIHLFDVIEQKTLRGKHLDDYPLFLVGADYNDAALKITRANLIQADIWAKVIWGDISNPDALAKDLLENYNIQLSNLLNVRTFLDHNRVWEQPQPNLTRTSTSSGAFATKGIYLSNNTVEANLKEHLLKWKPYVEKFGLLIIELHTIPPQIAAENIGQTAVTAYDATHGFSDQYILEIDNFIAVCKEVGLIPDPNAFRKFPDSELATVSVNLLKA